MIDTSFSPKVVATALGVSESSLKRWCDCGKIEVTKTVGGHRRILRNAVINFARDNQYAIAKPNLLGLPNLSGSEKVNLNKSRDAMLERLIAADEVACRRIILELYLAGYRVSSIGDQVIAPVFEEIGRRWECASLEVYQERLSCEICSRSLMELRGLLKPPAAPAPLAIGGTPEDDPYTLATSLVEMVVTQNRYRAVSLGARIPWDSLFAAVEKIKPQLLWFSVSHLIDADRFVDGFDRLRNEIGVQIPVIVGGRAVTGELLARMPSAVACESLTQLDSILQNFNPGRSELQPQI